MGCQTTVILGNNLTFTITTHDPDTGVLTDADSAPAYRVYEDETGTAILTGTMAKLDDANTTGFYSEQIACTAGNGFEVGKSYNVYIEATVDGDTGGISYGFTVEAALTDVADAILDRDLSAVGLTSGRRSLGQAIRKLVNKVSVSLLGVMTVYEEDDSTPAWTADVTTNPSANNITEIDPT